MHALLSEHTRPAVQSESPAHRYPAGHVGHLLRGPPQSQSDSSWSKWPLLQEAGALLAVAVAEAVAVEDRTLVAV